MNQLLMIIAHFFTSSTFRSASPIVAADSSVWNRNYYFYTIFRTRLLSKQNGIPKFNRFVKLNQITFFLHYQLLENGKINNAKFN